MAKKKVSNQQLPIKKRNGKIILIVLVVVVLIGGIIWFTSLRPSVPTVGQAYRPGISVAESSQTDKSVYFQPSTGYASPGDTDIDIPIYVKAGVSAGSDIQAIAFCLKFSHTKFIVRDLIVTKQGFGRMQPSSNVVEWLSQDYDGSLSVNRERCPSGYTREVDITKNMDTPTGITSGEQIGVLKLSVSSDATLSGAAGQAGTPEIIEIKTVYVSGVGYEPDTTAKSSSTTLYIVPPCPDTDQDGFPASVTFSPFSATADYRACRSYDAVADAIQPAFDCDDNDAQKFPGNPEVCDGKDNNCAATSSIAIDEGLSGSVDNANTKGVCSGKKICLGTGSLINSYDVPEAQKATVKANSIFAPFVSFQQRGQTKYSFDVYQATETLCDGLDNDCDGNIDEFLTNCKFGDVSIVGVPPGNIWVEYDQAPATTIKIQQELQDRDGWLENVMALMYQQVDPAACGSDDSCCGFAPHLPCEYAFADGQNVHLCRDGTYYLEIISGNSAGNIYKMSPNGDIVRSGVTITACPSSS